MKKSKAQIARENGAKSNGPKTDAGKARSAQNGAQTASQLDRFTPHAAILCNEDRAQFNALLTQLDAEYRPLNRLALSIVRDIAVARWQVLRLDTCITTHWNLALVDNAQKPATVAPELNELQIMARAAEAANTIVDRFNRQIDHLQLRIARLERRLKYVHTHFPNGTLAAQTKPEPTQPVENTSGEPEKTTEPNPENTQPLFVTENNPAVVEFYKKNFPGREIVFLPADDVANGIDVEDDMPDIPRKVN